MTRRITVTAAGLPFPRYQMGSNGSTACGGGDFSEPIHRKLLEPCPAGSEHWSVCALTDTGLRLPGLFAELASGRSHLYLLHGRVPPAPPSPDLLCSSLLNTPSERGLSGVPWQAWGRTPLLSCSGFGLTVLPCGCVFQPLSSWRVRTASVPLPNPRSPAQHTGHFRPLSPKLGPL